MTDDEYEEMLSELKKRKIHILKKEESILNTISEKTQKEKNEARILRNALINKGFSDKDIFYHELYKKSIDEANKLTPKGKKFAPLWAKESIHLLTEDEKNIIDNQWKGSVSSFFLKELKCKNKCGSIRKEFSRYRLYDVPEERMREYLLYSDRQYMLYKYCNFPFAMKNISNKANFNSLLKDIIHRRWFIMRDLSFDEVVKNIRGLKEIIVKPVEGTLQGDGVEKLVVNEDEFCNIEVYEHILSRGNNVLVEECIYNHPDIAKIYPNTLNTIIVITMAKEGKVDVLCSVIKFGCGDVVDNLHKGGIVAGVDVNNGMICTDAVNSNGIVCKTHPVSGETIFGK